MMSFPTRKIVLLSVALIAAVYFLVSRYYFDKNSVALDSQESTTVDDHDHSTAIAYAIEAAITPDDGAGTIVGAVRLDEPPVLELYKAHLDNSSEPSAQLGLFLILKECSQYPSRTPEELNAIELDEHISIDVAAELRANFEKCQEIYEFLGDIDIRERGLAWLESAADGGHPVAKLLSIHEYPEPPPLDISAPLIYEAFQYSGNDPTLLEEVYWVALKHYRYHIEPTVVDYTKLDENNYRRGVNSDAWSYLDCEHSKSCDIKAYLDRYDQYFYPYDKTAMIERATELKRHIQAQRWSDLGLELEPEVERAGESSNR